MGGRRAGGSDGNRWSFRGPSAPDTAAVLETGPGGQREGHSGGCTMFCRERNTLSLMGPTQGDTR